MQEFGGSSKSDVLTALRSYIDTLEVLYRGLMTV